MEFREERLEGRTNSDGACRRGFRFREASGTWYYNERDEYGTREREAQRWVVSNAFILVIQSTRTVRWRVAVVRPVGVLCAATAGWSGNSASEHKSTGALNIGLEHSNNMLLLDMFSFDVARRHFFVVPTSQNRS